MLDDVQNVEKVLGNFCLSSLVFAHGSLSGTDFLILFGLYMFIFILVINSLNFGMEMRAQQVYYLAFL